MPPLQIFFLQSFIVYLQIIVESFLVTEMIIVLQMITDNPFLLLNWFRFWLLCLFGSIDWPSLGGREVGGGWWEISALLLGCLDRVVGWRTRISQSSWTSSYRLFLFDFDFFPVFNPRVNFFALPLGPNKVVVGPIIVLSSHTPPESSFETGSD